MNDRLSSRDTEEFERLLKRMPQGAQGMLWAYLDWLHIVVEEEGESVAIEMLDEILVSMRKPIS